MSELDIRRLLRDTAPQALGILTRRFADFAAAEDGVQEALIAAVAQWPHDGVPENPRAWLIRVAARRMTDEARAESARRRREEIVVSLIPPEEQPDTTGEGAVEDDTLDLLFMCGHPSLSPASSIALTLRAVGGLTTAEIARAFLVPEATMAQRISRAKATIKESGVPFERPDAGERAARLAAVTHVLYLIFNEGYTASEGPSLARVDLSDEAIRLTRLLRRLVPSDPEVAGLLALMLLTDARRAARTGPAGELIPLDEQDRALWDPAAIAEGVAILDATLPGGTPGPYQASAAIAALHDEAPSTGATDWPQILALYDLLHVLSPDNPMVALNQTIAFAMVHGPADGLVRLDALAADPRLANHYRVDAVRAHLLERSGDLAAAAASYRRAAAHATSVPERDYLALRAARVDSSPAEVE